MHDPQGSLNLLTQALDELNRKANGDGVTAQAVAQVLRPHVQALQEIVSPKEETETDDARA